MTVMTTKKPLVLTGTGTTAVSGTIKSDQVNCGGIEIFNTDLTQHVYVLVDTAANSPVADATCQAVGAGQRKIFAKKLVADTVSIVFPGAGTAKVLCTPQPEFDGLQ